MANHNNVFFFLLLFCDVEFCSFPFRSTIYFYDFASVHRSAANGMVSCSVDQWLEIQNFENIASFDGRNTHLVSSGLEQ